MTIENLKNRLLGGAQQLEQLHKGIDQLVTTTLPPAALEQFDSFPILVQNLRSAVQLLPVRAVAEQTLTTLLGNVTPSDTVLFAGVETPFYAARLLSFQSYLSCTWAVCDLTTKVPGLLLGTKSAAKGSAKLWTDFVKNVDSWPSHPASIVHYAYAWPVALSSIIRNHFIHDGAWDKAASFFEGQESASGYQISQTGLDYILKETKDKRGCPSRC